jgi:hypothetical protein
MSSTSGSDFESELWTGRHTRESVKGRKRSRRKESDSEDGSESEEDWEQDVEA